jgi:hypothetical protein
MTSQNGYAMAWKPAQVLLPAMATRQRALGQGGVETFVDSPLLSVMTDFTAAAGSAYVAYGFGKADNKWSTFFWVISAMSAVKLLHDLSRKA